MRTKIAIILTATVLLGGCASIQDSYVNPMNWFGKIQKKLPGDMAPIPGRFSNPRFVKPETKYGWDAAKNWALATGARAGVEGIKSLVHSEEPWVSGARAAEVPAYSNYQDPIMRMARDRNPGLEVTLNLPYTG